MKYVAEIRDPIHGYIKISETERELIDSPYLQRLRYIKQLAGTYLVYPGATHTRFEHVLGAMYVAGKVSERLEQLNEINNDTANELRLAALLHDVGHGPFSHVFDELWAEKGITHEEVTRELIQRTELADILVRNGFSPKRISTLAIGEYKTKNHFLNDVISGSLSTDIMDYLLRDSYFTGVEYGKVDIHRIIDSICVAEDRLALDKAALYAFEALLIARYEMFKAVYFHRTVRAAQIMLIRAMQLVDETIHLTDRWKNDTFLGLTDDNVLAEICFLDSTKNTMAKKFAKNFIERKLLKCAYEKFLQLRETDSVRRLSPKDKKAVEKRIAEMANVDERYVYLDVPLAPSIPYTSERQLFETLTLVDSDEKNYEKVPVERLPLVGAISGYLNVFRVYTTEEHRNSVRKALKGKNLTEIIG